MTFPNKQIQAHHQNILDSIADGVFTVDKEMCITPFNRAAEEITKISRNDAVGLPCYNVLGAKICEENCLLRKTIETEQPVKNFPVYILRADQQSIPISVTTALLKDSGGRVIGGVETFRDLTAVNKLRKKLRKQHSFEDIVSKNAKMLNLFAILPQVAESNSSVLIEGASGRARSWSPGPSITTACAGK